MKKILTLILTMSLISYSFAQQSKFGLRGGFSTANWTGLVLAGSDFEVSNVNGFHFGGYGNFRLAPVMALEPGLQYSKKGVVGTAVDGPNTLKATNNSSYIDLPLLVRLYIGGFNFIVGPQASFLLSNSIDLNFNGELETEDTKEFFEEIDFGLVLGVGYEFNMGLNLSATFEPGLTDILRTATLPDGHYYTWTEAKNKVLKISVGYSF